MTGKENNIGHGQSRELMFRAWNKRKNKMKIVDELNHISSRAKDGLLGVNGVNGTIGIQGGEFDECYVMQRTGLTDKNGVRMFEGDIIYGSINKANAIIRYVTEIGQYRFFFYTGGRHDLLQQGKGGLGTEMWSWLYPGMKKVTVIGNIHENKDLLTS